MMRYFTVMLLTIFLLGCKPANETSAFVATDITGADFSEGFSLNDHTGKPRTLAEFKGKAVALFFGYTHCPDVCPTTMVDLKHTMKSLGPRADELQVLFVTLDPERDTQEVLAQFVPSFDKRFIGLRGSLAETEATTKVFKIFANKVKSEGRGGYTIDHSAGIYVFDKSGKVRLYMSYGQKPEDMASDIRKIL